MLARYLGKAQKKEKDGIHWTLDHLNQDYNWDLVSFYSFHARAAFPRVQAEAFATGISIHLSCMDVHFKWLPT